MVGSNTFLVSKGHFSLYLLQVPRGDKTKNLAEVYLELSQTCTMELFCKNSWRLLAIDYFCKKTPLQTFNWVLDMPLFDLHVFKPPTFSRHNK